VPQVPGVVQAEYLPEYRRPVPEAAQVEYLPEHRPVHHRHPEGAEVVEVIAGQPPQPVHHHHPKVDEAIVRVLGLTPNLFHWAQ
jgi:hypothetical protein